jgi:hypothetical protein
MREKILEKLNQIINMTIFSNPDDCDFVAAKQLLQQVNNLFQGWEQELKEYKTSLHNPIRCIETGKIYAKIEDAAKDFGYTSIQSIYFALKNKTKLKGQHFEYISLTPGKPEQ